MTFQTLIDKLSKDYEIELLKCTDSVDLQAIALIDGKHELTSLTTVYFGYDKQLTDLSSLPPYCILSSSERQEKRDCRNLAIIAEDKLFAAFNDASSLIKGNLGKGIFEELTLIADQTHNIDAVINAASLHLQNTLIFCDRNFKILSSSTAFPVMDTLWADNIKRGYCSYEFINEVKKLQQIKNSSYTTASIEVNSSPYRKLGSKVFYNQAPVGFLLLIEGENPINPTNFEMLSIISHVISYTVSFYLPNLFDAKSIYHEILNDLLIGVPMQKNSHLLTELTFPKKMLAAFLRPARYLAPSYLKDTIDNLLMERIPGVLTTFTDKGIAAVIPLDEDVKKDAEVYRICKELCETKNLRIGISNAFYNIEYFATYYAQAHAALELGQKLKEENLLCLYCDYQIYDLFSESKHPEKLGRFCHPALGLLRQVDQENQSELYKTLCIFIENACSIKLTAATLFIHRNSLVYRLNRIVELCNLDLADTNTLFLLRLSFLIDRYNGLNTMNEMSSF